MFIQETSVINIAIKKIKFAYILPERLRFFFDTFLNIFEN